MYIVVPLIFADFIYPLFSSQKRCHWAPPPLYSATTWDRSLSSTFTSVLPTKGF
ncbi:MAG: hypothetical protein QXF78_04530 [Pyrobaculum sp.]